MDSNALTQIVGLSAGVCTGISLLPQLIKLIKEKKSENISIFYLIILFVGLALWIWYGFLRDDLPVLLTNIVAIILNGTIIVLGLRYKNNH